LAVPVDVKASASLLEPGLVGILRPVVILPEGLMSQLSQAERDAILAHELSHFCSDDNLTASIHMLVEALFWFYPPVWLIGARLIAERERACDENVLAEGHDAEVYARGILKVCHFCIQSPLACASGASGADLGSRMRQIMSGDTVSRLHPAQKLMLAAALYLTLGLPVAEGFFAARPLMVEMQQSVAAAKLGVATSIMQVAAQARQISERPAASIKAERLSRLKTSTRPQNPSPQAEELTEAAPTSMPSPDTIVASVAPPQPSDGSASAPTPAPAAEINVTSPAPSPVREVLVALYPQGNGDPDNVTCRLPEALPGSRLPGPRVCQTNRQWAMLRARHEDIGPDGETIIRPDGSEENEGYAMRNCALVGRISASWVANSLGVPLNVCF
jgi:BlaR1 peptidase M56